MKIILQLFVLQGLGSWGVEPPPRSITFCRFCVFPRGLIAACCPSRWWSINKLTDHRGSCWHRVITPAPHLPGLRRAEEAPLQWVCAYKLLISTGCAHFTSATFFCVAITDSMEAPLGSIENPIKCNDQDFQKLLRECLESGQMFSDPTFPAEQKSIGMPEDPDPKKEITWQRPKVDLCVYPPCARLCMWKNQLFSRCCQFCWLHSNCVNMINIILQVEQHFSPCSHMQKKPSQS